MPKTNGQKQMQKPAAFSRATGRNASIFRRLVITQSIANGAVLRVFNTSVATATDWSSIAGVYGEFRVHRMRSWINGLNVTDGYLVCGTDYTGTLAAVGSAAAVFALERGKMFNADTTTKTPPSYEVCARDPQHFLFASVSAGVNYFATQIYNGSGTTGTVFTEFLVEFRSAV